MTKFKLSRIALAAAGVVLNVPAFAINADNSPGAQVYLSGATAEDDAVLEATIKMCKAGTLTAYTASNQFVYYCNADGTKILITDNTKLAVYKHSVGGSANGVGPINDGSALPFLDLALIAGGSGGCPAPTAATSGGLQVYQKSACTGSPTSTVANVKIGISDVEPAFFGGPSTYNNLLSEALASVIFGVPVTKNVYDKLQIAQTIPAAGTNATNCGATGLEEACMPSLSTGQITSLFTQNADWTTVAGITGLGNSNKVFVARRVDTSGTQKTFEALIARTPNGTSTGKSCNLNTDIFLSGTVAADNNAVANLCATGAQLKVVVNGSGSGQVAACLNQHQTDGRGAIGVLTTEAVTSSGGLFRFVKVNGVAPTAANLRKGAHTHYADASLNTRQPLSGATAAYYTALKTNFAVIPVIQPFGEAGLETLNEVTGGTSGNPFSRTNTTTGNVDNCQQGRLIF